MVTAAPANLYGFIVSFHGLLIGYSKRTRSSRAFVRFDLATRRQTRKRARERERERQAVIGQRLLFAIPPVGLHGVWAVGKKAEKGRKV